MYSYQLSFIFTASGFFLSCISNFVLIYLTVIHVKKVSGTYRRMVIYFALLGVFFTGLEMVAQPFAHNYKTYLIIFSTNQWIKSRETLNFLLSIWIGFYIVQVAFISVQFFYRFLCVFHTKASEGFDGWKTILWIVYPFLPAIIYLHMFYGFCSPDDDSDRILRETIFESYALEIAKLPRFMVNPYNLNGSFRIGNIFFLIFSFFLLAYNYCVILYCGLRMHYKIREKLKTFSKSHQKLQHQFFRALVVQSLGPAIFLLLPVAPVLATPLLAPYLGVEVNIQFGWIYSVVGLFPPFDSISFMLIVSEYRAVIRSRFSTTPNQVWASSTW